MASFTNGDNIDWLWGSLKPWQILHSTLAERERYGSVLDVWELVNQTLNASTTRAQEGDGGPRSRSHGMTFLGDIIDGDFWRHGGVMESRVKECLIALKDEEELGAAAQYSLQLPAAHHHDHQYPIHTYNTELAIAISTVQPPRSIALKSATAADVDDQHSCKVEEERDEADIDQEGTLDEAAGASAAAGVAAAAELEEEGIHGYSTEEEEEEEEAEEEEEEEDRHTDIIREANSYSLISSNYQSNCNYREINRECASVVVLNRSCSAAAGAAGDDQEGAEGAKELEGGMAAGRPDVEENIEVCAVCLEKLTHYYEEGVQALACRHAFHTACIAPWLQRQPHACCPCCRAPIFPANLGGPLHLAAPLDVEVDHYRLQHDRYACAGLLQQQQAAPTNDIMGLLADMEAALEHLGFRS